ncbi:structure-specific endonuclease subunit slx1 [Diorhabda carinulata]|uniref:structure-specific endonuclease subunit slx1 n=1 Tax=Diorhabda carinulata TaxID=1163345 RepID=UPI0025A0DD6A|nr:structure-specific endonuclease subunit slx1 [Diorhabda carinulata]
MSADTIENFYGVYLLYCLNIKYKGRTYIGYTVDPNRRIKQHNKGKQFGGAWKTSNKGPWSMVLIIHGFPNDISALRFEWAWQHPHVSRRLKHVSKKKKTEKTFDFCIRVLSEMLQVGPWCRLPLCIRWLNQDFITDFPVCSLPPLHMPICNGAVVSKKVTKPTLTDNNSNIIQTCDVCSEKIITQAIKCVNYNCDLTTHLLCLSNSFLKPGEYIPIEGRCPKCENIYLWGDYVRKYKGCYNNVNLSISIQDANELYLSDSE